MIITDNTLPPKSFQKIIDSFPNKRDELLNKNRLKINEFFIPGNGVQTIKALLFQIKALKHKEDIQGLYVFFKEEKPFYVGISGSVIKRIHQHVKGKNHFSSSLCYKIGSELHFTEKGEKHSGGRTGLDFEKYGGKAKEALSQCEFCFIEMVNEVELYLFEVYMSLHLNTYYNQFKTH